MSVYFFFIYLINKTIELSHFGTPHIFTPWKKGKSKCDRNKKKIRKKKRIAEVKVIIDFSFFSLLSSSRNYFLTSKGYNFFFPFLGMLSIYLFTSLSIHLSHYLSIYIYSVIILFSNIKRIQFHVPPGISYSLSLSLSLSLSWSPGHYTHTNTIVE